MLRCLLICIVLTVCLNQITYSRKANWKSQIQSGCMSSLKKRAAFYLNTVRTMGSYSYSQYKEDKKRGQQSECDDGQHKLAVNWMTGTSQCQFCGHVPKWQFVPGVLLH